MGQLELLYTAAEKEDYIAVICHPHPLYGGTLQNKVVTTLSKVCTHFQIPHVRFNFRGVGQSSGVYDKGKGEQLDCLTALQYLRQRYPSAKLCLMGFSFGAFVAAAVAAKEETALLVTIAPPVGAAYFGDLPKRQAPWIIVQPEADEIIDPTAVFAWYATLQPAPDLIRFPETGHFFHGKLTVLKERLIARIEKML